MVKNNGIMLSLERWIGFHSIFHLHHLIVFAVFPADVLTRLHGSAVNLMILQDLIPVVTNGLVEFRVGDIHFSQNSFEIFNFIKPNPPRIGRVGKVQVKGVGFRNS